MFQTECILQKNNLKEILNEEIFKNSIRYFQITLGKKFYIDLSGIH